MLFHQQLFVLKMIANDQARTQVCEQVRQHKPLECHKVVKMVADGNESRGNDGGVHGAEEEAEEQTATESVTSYWEYVTAASLVPELDGVQAPSVQDLALPRRQAIPSEVHAACSILSRDSRIAALVLSSNHRMRIAACWSCIESLLHIDRRCARTA